MEKSAPPFEFILKYGLIITGILLLMFIPEQSIYNNPISLCIFKSLTGIQCPLCGMTRASCELVHLHFRQAFLYNPVSLFLPLLLINEIGYDLKIHKIFGILRKYVFLTFLFGLGILFLLRIVSFIW
jgi:hypothetical protein